MKNSSIVRQNRLMGGWLQPRTYVALFAATCLATAAATPPSFACLPFLEPDKNKVRESCFAL